MATCDICLKSGIKPGKMNRHKDLHCKGRRKKVKMPKRRGTSIDLNRTVIVGGNEQQKKAMRDLIAEGE